MRALDYYLARQRGVEPDEAAELAGGRDAPSPNEQPPPPAALAAAQPPPNQAPQGLPPQGAPPPQLGGPPPPPLVPANGGPPPTPAPEPGGGLSAQLASALSRGMQRRSMPADINDDALAKKLEADEQDQKKNEFAEALRSAFARNGPPRQVSSGPSASTQALMQRRNTFQQNDQQDRGDALKAAEILKGEQPKPLDPSLVALHDASALQLAGLQKERETAEARRVAEDADKKTEVQRKAGVETQKLADETKSLEGQRNILKSDPRVRHAGYKPDDIDKLDRKGLEDLQHEISTKGASGAGGPKMKTLPAEQLASLGDFDTATKSVDELAKAHQAAGMSGMGSSVASMIPSGIANATGIGSKTAEYNDRAHATAQAVGIILEHGKLSDRDVPRYLHMLPEAGDGPDRVAEKAANIHRLLQDEKASRLKTFSEGGYNTPKDGAGGDTVRVRRKSDGTTGSMPRSKVDGSKYEILQ